ncbi:MAG: class I SAM-dependent methyltransferase [Sedimenticolaceae bacterium]
MPPNSLRQNLGYLNWLLNPRHGLDASGIYDLLSTGSPTERGLYLNLGYWRDAATIDEASDALAMLVAESGRMGAQDRVLDCGFGFGDQDILWAQTLQPKQIIGLNITESQVSIAQRRIAEAGLQDQVDLRHGSATEMPIAANSMDLVVALESAFHFRTRERFFREAWRVLRPGGRLVTADIVPMPPVRQRSARLKQQISWGLVASKFAIPNQNIYTLPGYRSLLERCGFEAITVESIRDQVYAPLHRYLVRHPERLLRLHPTIRLVTKLALRSEADSVYAGLDYLLSRSEKPSESRA